MMLCLGPLIFLNPRLHLRIWLARVICQFCCNQQCVPWCGLAKTFTLYVNLQTPCRVSSGCGKGWNNMLVLAFQHLVDGLYIN